MSPISTSNASMSGGLNPIVGFGPRRREADPSALIVVSLQRSRPAALAQSGGAVLARMRGQGLGTTVQADSLGPQAVGEGGVAAA